MAAEETTFSDSRVLIVEDEPLISDMLEEFMEELGCKSFHTVRTAEGALASLDEYKPDVVLLDVALIGHEVDFSVADVLDDRGIPCVFSTGYGKDILPERHRGRPVASKPYGLKVLAAAIAAALAATSVES